MTVKHCTALYSRVLTPLQSARIFVESYPMIIDSLAVMTAAAADVEGMLAGAPGGAASQPAHFAAAALAAGGGSGSQLCSSIASPFGAAAALLHAPAPAGAEPAAVLLPRAASGSQPPASAGLLPVKLEPEGALLGFAGFPNFAIDDMGSVDDLLLMLED